MAVLRRDTSFVRRRPRDPPGLRFGQYRRRPVAAECCRGSSVPVMHAAWHVGRPTCAGLPMLFSHQLTSLAATLRNSTPAGAFVVVWARRGLVSVQELFIAVRLPRAISAQYTAACERTKLLLREALPARTTEVQRSLERTPAERVV